VSSTSVVAADVQLAVDLLDECLDDPHPQPVAIIIDPESHR
jgi:hypothetical protein